MSIARAVAEAKTPQGALLAIAAALDRIEAKLDEQPQVSNSWGPWGDQTTAADLAAEHAKPFLYTEEFLNGDDLIGVDASERQLVVEARRRLANDEGQSLNFDLPAGDGVRTSDEDDSRVVELPKVSPELEETRRQLAAQIDLDSSFKREGLNDAYVKGGPMWLYLSGKEGRDFMVRLPFEVRQRMVQDVQESSPRDAYELGRDLLKARSTEETASMQKITEEALG